MIQDGCIDRVDEIIFSELVVSVVAIRKGNGDMSIGNIIGSNVANFSMVLGALSLIKPLTINLQTSYLIYLL